MPKPSCYWASRINTPLPISRGVLPASSDEFHEKGTPPIKPPGFQDLGFPFTWMTRKAAHPRRSNTKKHRRPREELGPKWRERIRLDTGPVLGSATIAQAENSVNLTSREGPVHRSARKPTMKRNCPCCLGGNTRFLAYPLHSYQSFQTNCHGPPPLCMKQRTCHQTVSMGSQRSMFRGAMERALV